jgi:hypothetical protein
MGPRDFNALAVAPMHIFTLRCPRISVSHNTISVQLCHGRESTRKLASRVQILPEQLNHGWEWAVHSAQLRLAYRFESEKLLNPANQVDPFYILKADISPIAPFLGEILKNEICWRTSVWTYNKL